MVFTHVFQGAIRGPPAEIAAWSAIDPIVVVRSESANASKLPWDAINMHRGSCRLRKAYISCQFAPFETFVWIAFSRAYADAAVPRPQ